MPTHSVYEYALVRVVPWVERGECINVGVILYCRSQRFLDARIALDVQRLHAVGPHLDQHEIERRLALIPLICAGETAAGELGQLAQAERFRWLVAPSSTVIQPSPVHSGLTANPAITLDHLLATLVMCPPAG